MMLNIWCVASIVIVFYHNNVVTSGNIVARDEPSDEEFSSADDVLRKLSFNFSSSGWTANEINDQLITFTLPTEKDEEMKSFVHKLFPDFSFDTVTSVIGNEPDISFQDLLLENMTINAAIKEISIGTRLTASVVVIRELVEVQDVTLVLRMHFKFSIEPPTFQSLEMAARWPVGTTNFEFYLSTSGSEVLCSANLENPTSNILEVKKFIDLLGLSFLPRETIIDNSNLEKLKLKDVQVNGSYKKNGNFELAFSGLPSLGGWQSLHEVRLVITRYTKEEFTHTAVTTALKFNTIKLSDAIYKATGVDIRDVPALGTTQPSKTTIFISTDDGMSDIHFDLSDKDYQNTTSNSNGITVQFGLSFSQAEASTLFFAYFSFGKLIFKPAGIHSSLNFEKLIYLFFSDISVDRQNLQLPPGVSSILHLQVSHFNVSTTTGVKTLSVNLKFNEPIDILPGYIRMHNTSLYFNTTFSKPRRTAVTAVGVCTIGSYLVQFSIEPLLALDGVAAGSIVNSLQGYVVRGYTKILNIPDLLSTLHADSHLSQVSSIGLDKMKLTNVKLIGMYNKSNAWALGLSAVPSFKGWDSLVSNHVLITGNIKEHTVQTMFTQLLQFKSLKLSLLINKAVGVDLNDVPFLGTLQASNVEFGVSTGDVSPHLPPQLLDGSMARMADVRKGMTVQADLNLMEDEDPHKFLIRLSPDWIKVSPRITGRSFNLQSLLKVTIPDLSVDSLSLPPEIENIGIAEVSSFDIRIMSGIKILLVNLTIQDSFDIIPGYLTINTSSLLINTTFNKPRKSTFAISGTWTIGSNSIDVYLETTSKLNVVSTKSFKWQGLTYVLRGYAKTIDFASLLTKLDVKYVMNQMSTIDFDDMQLDDIKLRGWYVKDETVVICLTADASISGWQFLSDSQIVLTSNLNRQKARTVLTTALRLDSLKLSDLSDVDISSYPFVGSVLLSNVRLFLSSSDIELNPLHNQLISERLQNGNEIRKGVTIEADLHLDSMQATQTYMIQWSSGMIKFDRFNLLNTLKLRDLLKVTIPDFLADDLQLPSEVSNVLDLPVIQFGFNTRDQSLFVTVTIETSLVIIPEILIIKDSSLSINTTLSKPRKVVTTINGLWKIGSTSVNISMSSTSAKIGSSTVPVVQNEFHGYAKSINIREMLSEIRTDCLLSNVSNIDFDTMILNDVKVMGVYNKGKTWAVGFSGIPSIDGLDSLVGGHVMITGETEGDKKQTIVTVALKFDSLKLSILARKAAGVEFGTETVQYKDLSKVGLVASTGDLNPNLLPKFLTGALQKISDIYKGLTVVADLRISGDEAPYTFLIRLSPESNKVSFVSKDRSFNVQSLLKLTIYGLHMDNLPLPPGNTNIRSLEATSFDLNFELNTKYKVLTLAVNLKDPLDFIPGYVTITDPSLLIRTFKYTHRRWTNPHKSPFKVTFVIRGSWTIGSNSMSVYFETETETRPYSDINLVLKRVVVFKGQFVLRGYGNQIGFASFLTKMDARSLMNQMSTTNFDDVQMNNVKLMGRYVKKDKTVVIGLSAKASSSSWRLLSGGQVMLTRFLSGHKVSSVLTTAFQLDSSRLSDLTRRISDFDISSYPFIRTVPLSNVALLLSSADHERNPLPNLLDRHLQNFKDIPKGVTVVADLRINAYDDFSQTYMIRWSKEMIRFDNFNSLNTPEEMIKFNSFYSLNTPNIKLPELMEFTFPHFFTEYLQSHIYRSEPMLYPVDGLPVAGFEFHTRETSLCLNATVVPSFVIETDVFTGILIRKLSLSINTTLSKPRKLVIKANGMWSLGSMSLDTSMSLAATIDGKTTEITQIKFHGYAKYINFMEISRIIHTIMGIEDFDHECDDKFAKIEWNNVKVTGICNQRLKSYTDRCFTIPSNVDDVLLLGADLEISHIDSLVGTHYMITDSEERQSIITKALHFTSFNLSQLVERVWNVKIANMPIVATLQASNCAVVASTDDLSLNLLPNLLTGVLKNIVNIRKGFTVVADLKILKDEGPHTFIILLSSNLISFISTGRSLNLQSLLKVTISDLSIDSLSLPSGIDNVGNLEVSSFDISTASGIMSLAVNLTIKDSFDIIPGYLTINTSSLLINTTFNKPRKSTFAISGTWTIGSNSIDVYLETTSKFNVLSTKSLKWQGLTYVLHGYAKTIDFASLLTKMDVKYVMNQMSTIDFDDMQLDDIKLRGWYVKDETVVICLTADASISGWQFLSDSQIVLTSNLNRQKARTVLTTVLRLDSLKLSDLIRKISDVEISSYPFVGSVQLSNIRLFNSSADLELNPLHKLIGGNLKDVREIRKDVTIVGDLSLDSTRPYSIRLSNGMITFDRFNSPSTLKLIELIKVTIPDFLADDLQLPAEVSNVLDLPVIQFGFNTRDRSYFVTVTIETSLVIIPEFLIIKDSLLSINTTLSKPRNVVTTINGLWKIGSTSVNISMSSTSAKIGSLSVPIVQNEFYGYAKSINIREMLSEIRTDCLLSDVSNIDFDTMILNDVKVMGVYNKGKTWAVGFSGMPSIDGWDSLVGGHVMITGDTEGDKKQTIVTIALKFDSLKLSILARKAAGVEFGILPVRNKYLSKVGLVASTGDLYPNLLPKFLTGALEINDICKGLTVVADLKISEDEGPYTFRIRLSPESNEVSFVSKERSFNLQSLLKLTTYGLYMDNLPLPPGNTNIRSLEATSFDLNFERNANYQVRTLAVNLKDPLDFIPGYVTITDPSLFIRTFKCAPIRQTVCHDSSSKLTFAIRGSWTIGTNSMSVYFETESKTTVYSDRYPWYKDSLVFNGLFVLRGYGNRIDFASFLTKMDARSLMNQMSTTNFDDVQMNNVTLMGRYVKKDKTVVIGLSAKASSSSWQLLSGGQVILTRYLSGHKASPVLTTAFQLDSSRLSDLTRRVSDVDISSYPFIGTLPLSNVALLLSSADHKPNPLPNLLGRHLQNVKDIRKGVTVVADLRISAYEDFPQTYMIRWSKEMIRFDSFNSLNTPNIKLPELMEVTISHFLSDYLQSHIYSSEPMWYSFDGLPVAGFEFHTRETSLCLTATVVPSFVVIVDIFTGILISKLSLSINTTLSKPRKLVIKANGMWSLGSMSFNMSMSLAATIDGKSSEFTEINFHGYANSIDFMEILSIIDKNIGIQGIDHEFYDNLAKIKLNDVKVTGIYNQRLESYALGFFAIPSTDDDVSLFGPHLAIPSNDSLVGIHYMITLSEERLPIFTTALLFTSFKLSQLVENVWIVNMADVPIIATLQASNCAVIASTDDLSLNLLPNLVTGVLKKIVNIRKGFTVVADMNISKDEGPHTFIILFSSNLISFISTGRSLNLQSLLKVTIPDLSIDSLLLPPGFGNVGNLEVSSFNISTTSGIMSLAANLTIKDSFDIIPGYLTITKSPLLIKTTFNKPRKSKFTISGTLIIGQIQRTFTSR